MRKLLLGLTLLSIFLFTACEITITPTEDPEGITIQNVSDAVGPDSIVFVDIEPSSNPGWDGYNELGSDDIPKTWEYDFKLSPGSYKVTIIDQYNTPYLYQGVVYVYEDQFTTIYYDGFSLSDTP